MNSAREAVEDGGISEVSNLRMEKAVLFIERRKVFENNR
jgi:hypothetical protein